ncbi:MAG: FAD-dependent thymidylate synthase [Chloroflexota bacterium]|nr:MAG: FAD-dependent thymidylate synthase [Chloroflexota bacterium]
MPENLIGKRVDVLDKGYVELQDLMPHPASGISGDSAIVSAARVSFLGESKGPEKDKKLLFYLMRNHHTSPFEMVEFKLRVRAPLLTWWQWTRHRTFHYQSANAQSGRYTPFDENDFYVPSEWRRQSSSNKQASEGTLEPDVSRELTDKLIAFYEKGYALYEEALAAGVAKEMARLFLPGFSVYYTWVVKTDAHNLMNFLRLRMASDAQYEIRVYAQAIFEHFFKPALPWTAEAFEMYVLNNPSQPEGAAT